MNKSTTVLVVDDHRMVCDALVALVEKTGVCKKAYSAYSGEDALDILHRERISIALVDARMPGLSGIALAKIMEHDFPLIKIIGMTSYDDTETLHEILQLNPAGILLKRSTNSSEISACLKAVRDGKNYFTEAIQQRIQKVQLAPARLRTHFTNREIEVLKLLSEGQSSKLIAEHL
ncbi:MAG: response regulator transcription factor, partial [Cyclobacteriaceae bacterium]|nr:response regulator transcription factor [Cyclobacteriaceae bacterium]